MSFVPHLLRRLPVLLQRTLVRALDHNAAQVSQAAAYSSIVALFPALIVAASALVRLPESAIMRGELSGVLDRVLPADVWPLLASYFDVTAPHTQVSLRAFLVAVVVSTTGASGVIVTFMEGLRRAADLPPDCWTFWKRRSRSFLLVPLSLVPLGLASVLVVFGHLLSEVLANYVPGVVRTPVFFLATLLRWIFALTGSVGLTALLYRMGTPSRPRWRVTLPGALMATAMWLASTLVFGWYVTRFANYSRVYGSLGAGIALLFWLYITAFSVLCGAEFNTVFHAERAGWRAPRQKRARTGRIASG